MKITPQTFRAALAAILLIPCVLLAAETPIKGFRLTSDGNACGFIITNFGAGFAAANGLSGSAGVTPGAWRNPDWFAVAWAQNPTSAPATITWRTNMDQVIQRQSFNLVKHDRVAQISEQHAFLDLAFSVTPTNLATINQFGYLTHLADGGVTVSVTSASFGVTNLLMLLTDGLPVDRYWNATTGSLRAAAIAAVDANLTNTTLNTFSTYAPAATNYVRNTNLWFRPAPVCLTATTSSGNGGATLVTPRHAIAAAHYSPQVGETLTWVSSNNVATQAVVTAINNIVDDLNLLRLDRAVSSIDCAKFLASPVDALPTGIVNIPLALGETHGGFPRMQLVIGYNSGWTPASAYLAWQTPTRTDYLNFFYHLPISGDSSQPVFLSTGSALLLLFCLHGPCAGPNIPAYKTSIQAKIAAWGDTNVLENIDTSTYTEF